jgi:hypothetical protein
LGGKPQISIFTGFIGRGTTSTDFYGIIWRETTSTDFTGLFGGKLLVPILQDYLAGNYRYRYLYDSSGRKLQVPIFRMILWTGNRFHRILWAGNHRYRFYRILWA